MGNLSQCSFTNNQNTQYQLIGKQNHFLYGQINHLRQQKSQGSGFGIKKLSFRQQKQFNNFYEFVKLYEEMTKNLPLVKIKEFQELQKKNQQNDKKQNKKKGEQQSISKSNQSIIKCNTHNFLFKSSSQQLSTSCNNVSQLKHHIKLYLQYIQQKNSLKSIISSKSQKIKHLTQNNKINQNILLQLQNKIKFCQYKKIDNLPNKERQIFNVFFNQLQILRIVDSVMTVLYGLKCSGVLVDSLRPQLIFKNQENEKYKLFLPESINNKKQGNFQLTYKNIKKWLTQEHATFHHNWNVDRQKQLISYIHPNYLPRLVQKLLSKNLSLSKIEQNNRLQKALQNQQELSDQQRQQNFTNLTNQQIQQQNIFSLGIIILQLCMLQPNICSKIYQISTYKVRNVEKQEQKFMKNSKIKDSSRILLNCSKNSVNQKSRKQLIQEKQNLTIKVNYNQLKKYLSMVKNKFSDKFFQLVQGMVLGKPQINQKTKKTNKNELQATIRTKQQQNCTYYTKYEQIIQKLNIVIQQNKQNYKQVYRTNSHTSTQKTNKLLSKNKVSQKNSRKSSLSRQGSLSGVTNNPSSALSNSNVSLLPLNSQQKVSSFQLLKKNTKKIQSKVDKLLLQNEMNHIKTRQFVKNEQKLQKLIMKDQQRILEQLNRLQEIKNVQNTKKRFGYRRMQSSNNSHSQVNNLSNKSTLNLNHSKQTISFGDPINKKDVNFTNNNIAKSHLYINDSTNHYQETSKNQQEQQAINQIKQNYVSNHEFAVMKNSRQKDNSRVNNTVRNKKVKLERVKQEQAMGNSVCKTIPISLVKRNEGKQDRQKQVNMNCQENSTIIKRLDTQISQKAKQKPVSIPQIQPFYQDFLTKTTPNNSQTNNAIPKTTHPFPSPSFQIYNNKSQLKNLIQLKNSQHYNNEQKQKKFIKQLKSQQLYEIYLNQYNNMARKEKGSEKKINGV